MMKLQIRSFGALLRHYRITAGLTQEQLAERAGLSTRGISDLERGIRHAPYKSTIARLAEALRLSAPARAAFAAAAGRSHDSSVIAPVTAPASQLERAAYIPPFVGRRHELTLVDQYLAGQGPPVLVLSGEPGIGKTRLLHETAQRGNACGWMVLDGGCLRQDGQAPYEPFLSALSNHLARLPYRRQRRELAGSAWLVHLLPELADAAAAPTIGLALSPEQERRMIFAAVRRFLANVAGPSGTLLLLDDLQWAGADALDLLTVLARSRDQPPLRLVCAYRNNEVFHPHSLVASLADLAYARLATHLDIGPLKPDDAAALLSKLFGELGVQDANGELQAEVVRRAGRVPFFLVSCAQSISPDSPENDSEGTVPWDVAQSISQRVTALPDPARELLGAAAIMGRIVPNMLLIEVIGKPEAETLPALEDVLRARLLIEADSNTYEFAHDLIREVVARDLSAVRRKVLHRRIAEALERQPGEAPAEMLAHHFSRCGDQQKAIVYLERAGDRAQGMRAYAVAETHYRNLIGAMQGARSAEDMARAREKLGQVLYSAARFDAAIETLNLAARTYRDVGNFEDWGRTLARLGWAHAHNGTVRAGLSLLHLAIEQLNPSSVSRVTLAEVNIALAELYSISADYQGQLRSASRARDLVSTSNVSRLSAQADLYCGYALHALDQGNESLTTIERLIPEAEDVGDLMTLSEALNFVAQRYEDQGEFDKSMPTMDRAVEMARRLGDPVQLALLMCNRGQSAFYVGNWHEARIYHERAVDMMQVVEGSLIATYPYGGLGLLSLAQGETEAGLRYLRLLQTASQEGGDIGALRYVCCALAEYNLVHGRADETVALLTPLLDRPGLEEAGVIKLLPLASWAYLVLDQNDEAALIIEPFMRRVSRQKARRLQPDGLRISAMLAERRGHWEEAASKLNEAVTLCDQIGYPYGKAKALYVWGGLLAERGELVEARERLAAAQSMLARLGEHLYAEHVCQALDNIATDSNASTA